MVAASARRGDKANPCSLYSMTRESQNFWTHRIDKEADVSGDRYSLTFRVVSACFRTSLLILGDSNSKRYKFGEGKGTMGIWTPGRSEYCPTIENIDPITCNVGSYKNIMIQVGINNLKSVHSPADINSVADQLMLKCHKISRMNSTVKLFICPVLPTRDRNLNRKAMYMNSRIEKCVENSFIFTMFDCNSLIDQNGLLRSYLCSKPGDPIHLGNAGTAEMVKIIKSYIHDNVPHLKNSNPRDDGRHVHHNVPCQSNSGLRVGDRLYRSANVNRGSVSSGVNRPGNVNMMTQHTTGNIYASRPLWS